MNEANNFALVRKPSGAVQKAGPKAKRIISGMAIDTLTLAKPEFVILMCDDQISDSFEVAVKYSWARKHKLTFIRFTKATELQMLTKKRFDLIFLYLGNVTWDVGSKHRFNSAVEFLTKLKAQYYKPIIATQGMDMSKQFAGTGITFIEAPWTIEQIRSVLNNFGNVMK